MKIRPEDLAGLSSEEKRALLVKLMKENARKTLSHPEASSQTSGELNRLAVNVADLKSQAVLDPEIRGPAVPVETFVEPEHIFLTGATGFLGAFLLHELLAQTKADIHCLVRCANPAEGKTRIMQNLTTYFPTSGHFTARIIPVPGDLSEPLLGLPASQFHSLAEKVNSIYHGGALVNWIYSYERLKSANVNGTQEVLRLASRGKTKPLHFISSISVFPLVNEGESKTVFENDSLDHGGVLYSGYAQSKWVAERLVVLAQQLGLPVAIYRPGLITGHSQTGAWNTDDVTCNLIKCWVEMGCAPELEAATDMTPVDYVSQGIVYLSRSPHALGQTYHLVNPDLVFAEDLVGWLRSFGYALETLPYESWREKLITLARRFGHDSTLSVAPLFSVGLSEETPGEEGHPADTLDGLGAMIVSQFADLSVRFDCRNTVSQLADTAIAPPPIDTDLFHNYLSFFISSGFMQAPDERGRA